MKMFDNLDAHPYTAQVECATPIKVKLVDLEKKPWLKKFFDGTENVEQITTLTPEKIYDVVVYEVMGDVADVTVINDKGERESFMDGFFEEVNVTQ